MRETTELAFDRFLMDGIQDIIFIMRVGENSDFYYEFLNRAAMENTGITQIALGKSIQDVCSEKTANFLLEHYNKVVTTHESVNYEDYYESSLGEKYYSNTTLTPLLDDEGRCKHIVALTRDITEKKWADFEIGEYWEKLNESKQRYQSLFHHNSDAIFSFDLKGHIIYGNDAVESVTGYLLQDLISANFTSLVVPEAVDQTKKYFLQALEGNCVSYQMTISKKSGERSDIMMKFTPIIINKEVVGVYGILKDITENIRLTKKYQQSEQRFRIIAENAQDLIILIDERAQIIYASPSHKNVLGFGSDEYIGRLFYHNIHENDKHLLKEALQKSIKTGHPCKLQIRKKHKIKGWTWFDLHGSPVFDDENKFMYMVCISRDVHLQKEYEEELEHFAYHDSLTELPNRRLFKEHLFQALKELEEKKDELAVIMMDIDHFKSINDQMGHDIGDIVIEEFSKRISNKIRDIDTVARLGGDEFVILLPSIGSRDNAVAIAKNIQKAMHKPWSIGGYVLEVTSSIGVAMAPKQGATASLMLKNADIALYEAKKAGRDSYKVY